MIINYLNPEKSIVLHSKMCKFASVYKIHYKIIYKMNQDLFQKTKIIAYEIRCLQEV